ncbi:transglutaminase-like domain-containing protein [Comamonas sp. Y33R10-2]|uniref:SirB1 family protein n=1 Tax=Comamonas sp. Y33R10-2 TaxID=2853257 RepID=UPI001C5C9686|nr:transglutaminase-like domain-containing protein [Comamonas sp. Y33R10-2]QXZ10229.1 transglutaminase-like domain-containing protein [Comamonas sp. Y33R10-2]
MNWTIDEHPTAFKYFGSLVQSDESFALMEAAISIAQDAEPDLDLQAVQAELDRLQVRLVQRLAGEDDDLRKLSVLNQFFYGELGFAGNLNNYYDPANSYIHHVLQTRRGIPISVALIWLELARSIDLPVEGIGFPGHFLVKVSLTQGQVVQDPLTGDSFSANALAERLQPYLDQADITLEDAPPLGLYLQAAHPRDVMVRMLRNLQEIHHAQKDWPMLVAVLNRLILLQPEREELYRDRGMAYVQWGVAGKALLDLERYALVAKGLEAELIAKNIAKLRQAD